MTEYLDSDDDGFPTVLKPTEPEDIKVEVAVRAPTTEQIANSMAQMALQPYGSASQLRQLAEEAVREVAFAKVSAVIGPVIEDLLSKPLQPTDGFGNPVGEPTTLTALIQHEASQYLTATVDTDGRPKKRDPYNRYVVTRLEQEVASFVRAMFKDGLSAEVRKMADSIKTATIEAIQRDVATAIAARVK